MFGSSPLALVPAKNGFWVAVMEFLKDPTLDDLAPKEELGLDALLPEEEADEAESGLGAEAEGELGYREE